MNREPSSRGARARRSHRVLLELLGVLPTHAVSRLAGRVMRAPLPAALRPALIGAFARAVGADLAEVRDPLESFASLQEFFTRALADGARPIDPAPDAVVAPCDGAWGAAGRIEQGTLVQVKGRDYGLAELLGGAAAAAPFDGGAFATFYLSPRDYHRFHAPCAARVLGATYLPGALWPVNRIGVEGVDALFTRNERLCASMAAGGAAIDLGLVAVGATMVGKVRLSFDDLSTNQPAATRRDRDYRPGGIRLEKGQEWGRFEFGSTIVMVAAPALLALDLQPPGTELRLGRRIGTLNVKREA